ncbi:MAG: acyltransferase family protein [Chthoniobacterales bacterium]
MKDHIPALDGLRGMAALMVMWFHFSLSSSLASDGFVGTLISKFCRFGQTGVDLFFVLSGFLITRILLVDKRHNGAQNFEPWI